ncbi:AAA family ATPase [Capnocytophaga cynodegmi]|uniref:Uncharacterized protein n=1 Tax=Capnocytophaga cynodegmi TaxID=28189 RepID=A0A0B7H6M9_9FLAO|nr:AAA family ATPase [Capnocytophaga cynodegmi]CEN33273.1 conserved hypothetical protein [Capnocytophaga cynodegmi]
MSFKLLAIRPLKGCDKRFLKNLKEGKIYQFYNEYAFEQNANGEVIKVNKDKSSVPENLYQLAGSELKINISALVGKNGSGKSTLIDLFIAHINQVSYTLRGRKILATEANITDISELFEFNCETYYEVDNQFYQLIIKKNKVLLKNISKQTNIDISNFPLDDFFYTIVVNYSLYAFKSLEEDKSWIENLFHKNDAYQVPIVLNPYREYGNININTENYLTKQRLLVIIVSDPKYPISDNLLTEHIEIKPKKSKSFFFITNDEYQRGKESEENDTELKEKEFYTIINNPIYSIHFSKSQIMVANGGEILKKFKDKLNIQKLPEKLEYRIDNYILYKIISICGIYPNFWKFLERKEKFYKINIDGFLEKFENTDSHILFKLKQLINFVKHYDSIWKDLIEESDKLSIQKISDKLKKVKKNNSVIELLPPPIYEVNFISKDGVNILENISSGEKQLIYSISTILYHLTNLNSVDGTDDLTKYKHINIILDEIELYFHPEYQRKFISTLLDGINNLKLSNIKDVNILFCTHSPFILSDIPKQNVLFLGEGKIENKNTFAGNISMMLSSSFFMKESLIGEFAKNRINQLLEKLNQQKEEYRKEEEDRKEEEGKKKTNKKEEDKYKAQIIMSDKEKSEALELIKLIDEPILKYKLNEMFCEAYPNFCKENEKKIRENELKALAEQYGFKIEIKK